MSNEVKELDYSYPENHPGRYIPGPGKLAKFIGLILYSAGMVFWFHWKP